MSERSRERLERDKTGARILKHDRGGYSRGCGCDDCTADHTLAAQERRGPRRDRAQDGDDLTVPVTVRLSEAAAGELGKRAQEAGVGRSKLARDMLHEALGIEDTARRNAPRLPNRARQGTAGKQQGKGQQS